MHDMSEGRNRSDLSPSLIANALQIFVRADDRDVAAHTEFQEMVIACHKPVRFPFDRAGDDVIVVRIVRDQGRNVRRFHDLGQGGDLLADGPGGLL